MNRALFKLRPVIQSPSFHHLVGPLRIVGGCTILQLELMIDLDMKQNIWQPNLHGMKMKRDFEDVIDNPSCCCY